jgi:hypothetical protein
MIRIASWMITIVLLSACGGSKMASLGKYGEECTPAMSCGTGLMCINKVCTLPCSGPVQCQAYSSKAVCYTGYCYDQCHDATNCMTGLTCMLTSGSEGVCKPF